MGVFEALKKRSSVHGGDMGTGKVSLGELSTILWAASGLNRGEKGWTVPMANGLPPYVTVHVAADDGVFRYDWKAHALVELSKENVKGKVASQSFVGRASYVLVFSTDPEGLKALRDQSAAEEFACVLVGAMTQDVYLAAAALKLGTRYIHSMKLDAIQEALGLPEGARPIAVMPVAK
ncbi:MAG: nitroreductase family protein [Deltaproteobacteria bacterium]|jgi:nitroreductase|nr:nitroreductase family protein [Deltaproteobacteria bacterium]